MKQIGDDVNTRPLSPGCTKHGGYDDPVAKYRGWTIIKWTGWKGNTFIVESESPNPRFRCAVCGGKFNKGDRAIEYQEEETVEHFDCSEHPLKGQIVGQWLAVKGDYRNQKEQHIELRFAYASVPGMEGEYKRGGLFDISIQPGQKALTPETPQTELEAAREEGLQRLKAAIDAIEDTVA